MWVLLPRMMKEISFVQFSVFCSISIFFSFISLRIVQYSVSIFLNNFMVCLIKLLLPFFLHNFDRTVWKIKASELCLDLLLNPITEHYHKKHQRENYWWCVFCEHATVSSKYKCINRTISQNHVKERWNEISNMEQYTT